MEIIQYTGISTLIMKKSITFEKSRRKKINDLLKKNVFEIIQRSQISEKIKILDSRFVDEIKNIDTITTFEKFRLVIQVYNDQEKTNILTQISTIQRMNQRLIFALAASFSKYDLYLRDISQTYVQSKSSLNRKFYARSSKKLGLKKNFILKIIKSLYEVFEAEAH